MRLIDADKLKGYRLERHSESNRLIVSKSIANVPTAYDVEDVVKQIEDASVELYGFAKVVGLDKVIELVRNGGVK